MPTSAPRVPVQRGKSGQSSRSGQMPRGAGADRREAGRSGTKPAEVRYIRRDKKPARGNSNKKGDPCPQLMRPPSRDC